MRGGLRSRPFAGPQGGNNAGTGGKGERGIPTRAGEQWAVDFVELSKPTATVDTMGGNFSSVWILIAVCRLSGWIEAAIRKAANALEVAQFILQYLVANWGPASYITFDGAKAFRSEVSRLLCAGMGTRRAFTLPYGPRANRAERGVQSVVKALRAFAGDAAMGPDITWGERLPMALYAARTVTGRFGLSAFQIAKGYDPPAMSPLALIRTEATAEARDSFLTMADEQQRWFIHQQRAHQDMMARLRALKGREGERYAEEVNQRATLPKSRLHYAVGEMVRVYVPRKGKTHRQWVAPYVVVGLWGPKGALCAVMVRPAQNANKPAVRVGIERVAKWVEAEKGIILPGGARIRPAMEELDEEEGQVYEVHAVVGERQGVNGTEYRVRWKGWGRQADSWVGAREVESYAKERVEAFKAMTPHGHENPFG